MNFIESLPRCTWGRLFCVLVFGLLFLVGPDPVAAQFKFRKPPNRQDPAALNERGGDFVWQQFLWNRAIGKFNFTGSLVYRPAGEKSKTYSLSLRANWKADSEETNILLSGSLDDILERKIVVDEDRRFYLVDRDCPEHLLLLSREELEGSLTDDLPISWFDLLMPYLYWGQPEYVGPERYIGRPAHRYALYNVDDNTVIHKVIVTLDEDYAAILKTDAYGPDDKLIKRMRVGGFKQFGSEWMFSELYWENRISRESLRLSVKTFNLGE